MAQIDYPILVFPTAASAERTKRSGGPGRLLLPTVDAQGRRVVPQFQRLQDALDRKRANLQANSLGITPEQVLVLETLGRVENFFRAVERIDGLEWLGELERDNIVPGDGFEDAEDAEKNLTGRFFLTMSDGRALSELRSLFNRWRRDPKAKFPLGLAPIKEVFKHLRAIRPWSVEDRLAETGLLEDWRDRLAFGQAAVLFEAELWYRHDKKRRQDASDYFRQVIADLDGDTLSECVLGEVAYHGLLGRIAIKHVRDLIDQAQARAEFELFRCEDVMFLRPTGQCGFPIEGGSENLSFADARPPKPSPQGDPVVALLDGLPLTGHSLLSGRLAVDDPDGFEESYQVAERSHGTAMASLICHSDLDAQEEALGKPLYVRPIMQPRRSFDAQFIEAIPEQTLPVDLLHRAVVRMFEGEGEEPPVSPGVRVINLSIGDPARQFVREMSAWARLLDWLSCKYNVLFVVSAGNHNRDISVDVPHQGIRALGKRELSQKVISAVADDTRNRRLLSPAETLNGITVGALHTDFSGPPPTHSIDPINLGAPSVLSAHGLGYRGAIKPDIYMPGGRQLLRQHPASPKGTAILQSIWSTERPGQRVARPGLAGALNATQYTQGTSNAAALCSRQACFLFELLESIRDSSREAVPREFDAVLLKALLVHGSSWDEMLSPYRDALASDRKPADFRKYVARFLGYGRPNFERVRTGAEQRVTVLGFGSLADGEAVEFTLPLPPSLSSVNVARRLVVTLAWFSPIQSQRQAYRVAHLWFGVPGFIARNRCNANHNAAQRGTLQHEIFEGSDAVAYQDGQEIIIKVNCRSDGGEILQPVRFGLVVTLEVPEEQMFPIPVYEEVRDRIAVRVRPSVNTS